ncbi:MAG: ribbon-helix-helix domain-containing protein [Arenicella sp.]
MCQLFIGADSQLWQSYTRSLRIDGVVSSVRLEQFFWNSLEEIAFRDDMTVNSLITKLYFESIDEGHDLGNFTSFLRVCCGRYHALIASGELPDQLTGSLQDVQSDVILERERQTQQKKKLAMASFVSEKQAFRRN